MANEFEICKTRIKAYLKDKDIPQKLINQIVEELSNEKLKLLSEDPLTASQKFNKSIQDRLEDIKFERNKQKMLAAHSFLAREKGLKFVGQEAFKSDPIRAADAYIMAGENKITEGGSYDVQRAGRAKAAQLMNNVLIELRKTGIDKLVLSGEIDNDILREMWALKTKGELGLTQNKEALTAAKILVASDHQQLLTLQNAGSPVKALDTRLMKNTHSYEKISKTPKDVWMADASRAVQGSDSGFGAMEPRERSAALSEMYDKIVSGKWGSDPLKDVGDQFVSVYGSSRNLGSKTSRARSFHFGDVENLIDYNRKYGAEGTLMSSKLREIQRASMDAAILGKFGPNPKGTIATVLSKLADTLPPDDPKRTILTGMDRPDNRYNLQTTGLLGSPVSPGSSPAARGAAMLRVSTVLSKVTGWPAAFIDTGSGIAFLHEVNGKNYFENSAKVLTDYFKNMVDKKGAKQIMQRLSIDLDNHIADLHAQVGLPDPNNPGLMQKALHVFHQASGLERHDLALKATMADHIAATYGEVAGTPFEQLSANMRASLGRYGFDATDWQRLSRAVINDGRRSYIDPTAIEHIPEDFFSGGAPQRQALQMRYLGMLSDYGNRSSMRPGLRQKFWLGNPDEGTGILKNIIGQFAPTAIQAFDNSSRVFFGNPETKPQSFASAIKDVQTTDLVRNASYMVTLAGLGYAKMAIKDLFQDKTPRDLKHLETWAEIAAASGVGGLYSDLIFSNFGTPKEKLGKMALGASGGTLGDAANLVYGTSQALMGDQSKRSDRLKTQGKNAANLAASLVPGTNLFYTKLAYDKAIRFRLEELMKPGTEKKIQDRTEKNGQQYIIPGLSPTGR